MVLRFDVDSTNDSDDLDNQPPIDIRERRLQLLEKQVKNRTVVGSIFLLTVGILTFVLFFNKNSVTLLLNTGPSRKIYSNSTHEFHQTTILISLDGFHPHYINPLDTPTMHNIMKNDYGAPYMTPSFPSLTFPNHWTLITGLYPSEHGIVGNTFYDPELKKQFINTNPKVGGLDPDFGEAASQFGRPPRGKMLDLQFICGQVQKYHILAQQMILIDTMGPNYYLRKWIGLWVG